MATEDWMTPTLFARAQDCFIQARELPEAQRSAFVAAFCGEDSRLIDFVVDLLKKDGEAPAPARPRLPGFECIEFLGEGGMGEVWQAVDQGLDRPVAVKILKYRNREAQARFIREAQTLAKLNHPHIVIVHQFMEHDHRLHIVMELLQGSLENALARQSPMPWRRATQAVCDAAAGLVAAHGIGLIHRDIKPSNLLQTEDGRIKLADFGLVHTMDSMSTTNAGGGGRPGPGTPMFMSPEQCCGKKVDLRTDLYSLACTYYVLLTGEDPFDGETHDSVMRQHREEDLPDPRRRNPEIPEAICRIIARAGHREVEQRYGSAGEMLADLQRALRQEAETVVTGASAAEKKIVLAYKRNVQPDGHVLGVLESQLRSLGHRVFIDRHLTVGVEWAMEIDRNIREADAVIPLLSAASVGSEMLAGEVELAHRVAQENGKLRILPVRVGYEGRLPPELDGALTPLQYFLWRSPGDDEELIRHLRDALVMRRSPGGTAESPHGAVPLDSRFYVVRSTDRQFLEALERRDAIVLLKGARQMGKTSLLARGLQQVRDGRMKAVITDFQKLTAEQFQEPRAFYTALGTLVSDQLDLDAQPQDAWDDRRAPNMNFERFIRRQVLNSISEPLVWAMDEVDRLFGCAFGTEVFALFRTWHNERALDPSGPWGRLTLAIAYATEAHLFIRDVNQSPFNVGTRLTLQDFTSEQIADLNRRYGDPLSGDEVSRFHGLIGGQPFLVRRGLHEMVSQRLAFEDFARQAMRDDGPYGDHLRRILVMLGGDRELLNVARSLIGDQRRPDAESFYRLRAAGLLAGDSPQEATFRCSLYEGYLRRHLA